MEQKTSLIVVDSDVFIRDLRYTRDKEYKTNKLFLESVQGKGATTLYNLLEVCGVLSFNLSPKQLLELFYYFPLQYQIEILPLHTLEGSLPDVETGRLFQFMQKKMSWGDAMVASVTQKFIPGADVFVSWNSRHFGVLPIPALTPAQYLKKS